LAGALKNHALALSRAGRPSAALKTAEEAVALYRDLAEEDPESLLPELANALNVVSIAWLELDWADPAAHADRALAAADGARDVWQRITDVEPRTREASPLAVSYHLRALSLSQLGRSEEAVDAADAALRYWQALASQEPGTYDGDIADALSTLAEVLSAAGHPEQALGPAEQAVAYYEPLVSTEVPTEDVEAELWEGAGSAWKVHAVVLCGVGRYADAVVYAAKSVRVYRELAAARPRAMLPDLIEALRTYAVALNGDGQRAQAQAERDEADRLTVVLNGLE
jgi:tetratricopeptide (TPR) repeat protein